MSETVRQNQPVNLLSLVPDDAIDNRIESLDGWSKMEQLGQGGFGDVFKYATPMTETPFAAGKHLKVQLFNRSKKQKIELEKSMETFVKELNVLQKVARDCSERCVQFLACYLDSTKIVLFTEFMPNGSIKDHINDDPLMETLALKYTFQATQGLHFLHHYKGGRIVHRDIKCDNLLLTSNMDVKLADFGLAYSLKVDSESFTMSAPTGLAGTLIYSAPEMLIGAEYGRRADIWSLGCTLVDMLTCQPPHADFWFHHKERAQFLFVEQARTEDPTKQLKYIGEELVPSASSSVQKLLDCLFIRNQKFRPASEDVLDVFVSDSFLPGQVKIDEEKLDKLKLRIVEEAEKSSSAQSIKTDSLLSEYMDSIGSN